MVAVSLKKIRGDDRAWRVNPYQVTSRQDADTRTEHQDDGVSHQEHVRMTLQEGFRMKQKDRAGCVRDTSRKGE